MELAVVTLKLDHPVLNEYIAQSHILGVSLEQISTNVCVLGHVHTFYKTYTVWVQGPLKWAFLRVKGLMRKAHFIIVSRQTIISEVKGR